MVAALQLGHDPVAHEAQAPLIHRNGGYAGVNACRTCHPDHHASWRATFHSTMTQRPSAATVRGDFDGRSVPYAGNTARPFRDGDGFFMEIPAADGVGRRTAEVALAVGSRRYQQYFERERRGDTEALVRLPILWHIGARRWLHLNTVFLGQDDPRWDAHRSTWNDNCIFCHNTAPEPRMVNYRDPARLLDADGHGDRFDSEVGELGIACESCHGPGAAHAQARRDPLGRYRLHFAGAAAADPTIVHPARLDQERSVSACGQCHGARMPRPLVRIADWLTAGPTFRAGDRLLEHVAPITAGTPVHGAADADLFWLRFWPDGTPRLTAYELQGVLASPCYVRGAMTCLFCHAMHAGDPRGQLRPDRPGNQLCTQCHGDIAGDVGAHTHHAPDSSGSSCVECHMPRMVYGILDVHRSHRIESPEPARDAENGRPHACTLCHVDQSLSWSAQAMRQFWGDRFAEPTRRRDGAPLALPDAIASLLAGDPVQRAAYATALGRATAVIRPQADAAVRAHLAITMGDGYPSVRWLAQRSLQAIEARAPIGVANRLAAIDHTAGPEARRTAVFGLLDAIAARAASGRLPPPAPDLLAGADFRLDLEAVIRLTDLQAKSPIAIGE